MPGLDADPRHRPARCRRQAAEGGAAPAPPPPPESQPVEAALSCTSACVAACSSGGGGASGRPARSSGVRRTGSCRSCSATAQGGGCSGVAAGGRESRRHRDCSRDYRQVCSSASALKLLAPLSIRLGPDEDCHNTSTRSCSPPLNRSSKPPHGLSCPHTVPRKEEEKEEEICGS